MAYNCFVILILVGVSVMNTGYYRSCCSNKLDPPPFFKGDFYFLIVFMCWKIEAHFFVIATSVSNEIWYSKTG